MQLLRPAPPLPLGHLDLLLQALGGDRLGGRDRDRGGRGERLQQPQILPVEVTAGFAVEGDQGADRTARRAAADQRGLGAEALAQSRLRGRRARLQMLGDAFLHRRLEDRVVGRDRQLFGLRPGPARLRGDREPAAATQQHQHRPRLDQRPAALDDQVEHPTDVGLAAHRAGDVGGGLGAPQGPLGFRLPDAQRRVEAGV